MCVNLCIGMITPPAGVNLFAAAPITGVSMTAAARAILPFLGVQLLALMFTTHITKLRFGYHQLCTEKSPGKNKRR